MSHSSDFQWANAFEYIPAVMMNALASSPKTSVRRPDTRSSSGTLLIVLAVKGPQCVRGRCGRRLSVAEGDSPNIWQYCCAKRPKCKKPQPLATAVTVTDRGCASRSSACARCRRRWRRYVMGGGSSERAKPFCNALALTPTVCASFPVVHDVSGCARISSMARMTAPRAGEFASLLRASV